MNNKKKKRILITLASLLLVIAVTVVAASVINRNNRKKEVAPPPTVQKSEPSSSSEPVEEDTNARDKAYYEALATLEKSDEKGSADDLKLAKELFQLIDSKVSQVHNAGEFEGTFDNGLSLTDPAMAQTFAMAMDVNHYKVNIDKIEVYKSENQDVIQFIVTMESKGKENSYWAGNINLYAKQAQIVSYHGGTIGGTFG